MKRTWWKEGIIYQIYPRSFKDSNGDGIGDIPGITSKLDYLKDLGVDIIWLCPVYESPNDDNGYDISDYRAIHEEFGSMSEFDTLLEGIHDRGMKLIMDLVVNHSSDEHKWFKEAKKSRDNPYRDYYIWRPSTDPNTPPNNWQSFFGGSAWEYSSETDEYFLHLFTRKQPDLNWENPTLRKEVYDMMNFWLEKGVDGFRMDVITLISKRPGLPEITTSDFKKAIEDNYATGPRIHEFLQEMNRETLSNYDVMTVGETVGMKINQVLDYVGEDRNELSMAFHFGHLMLGWGEKGRWFPLPWTINDFKDIFMAWDQAIGENGWNSIFLGNHDFPRIVSRWGNDNEHYDQSAKTLAMLLMTLRGTPYIYQGDEFGMTNVAFESIEDYDDIEIKNFERISKSEGMPEEEILERVQKFGRDNARTPVQWDDSENAGFTDGKPWMKVNPSYTEINAQENLKNPNSILNFYRKLIQLRKSSDTLIYGDVIQEDGRHEQVFAYTRNLNADCYLIVLNLSDQVAEISLDLIKESSWKLLLSSATNSGEISGVLTLQPWEGLILHKQ